jgi:hypothetical protein
MDRRSKYLMGYDEIQYDILKSKGDLVFRPDQSVQLFVFFSKNAPEKFRSQLQMTTERLEQLFLASRLSFHKYGTSIGTANLTFLNCQNFHVIKCASTGCTYRYRTQDSGFLGFR